MKNIFNKPPGFTIKVANAVFVLGILFSVLITIYAIYRIYHPIYDVNNLRFYHVSVLFGGLSAALFYLGLRLTDHLKINLSLMLVTATISAYIFETYLEIYRGPETPKELAEQMGVPYDTRTAMEVLKDLNNSNIKAYPNPLPAYFINSNGLNSNNGTIYPLGGISNTTTILSNELGYFPIIETDEHGFNNIKRLYNKKSIDIILTGDSFAEGLSVHSNETISAVLREFNFNAISIGKSSNGPFLEYASLVEYAKPLKPKVVLWLFYINDMVNLKIEMSSSILRRYLSEDDFSQNLISRQDEIDSVLLDYVLREWKVELNREKERKKRIKREKIANLSVFRVLKLTNFRSMIRLRPESEPESVSDQEFEAFKEILKKSRNMVSRWGGKLYFIYLPSYARFSTGNKNPYRKFVLRTVTELDIPIIDIHGELIASHPDPLSLFPFRLPGHLTEEGYRLVAKLIGKRLDADEIVPSNPKFRTPQ